MVSFPVSFPDRRTSCLLRKFYRFWYRVRLFENHKTYLYVSISWSNPGQILVKSWSNPGQSSKTLGLEPLIVSAIVSALGLTHFVRKPSSWGDLQKMGIFFLRNLL